MTMQVKEERVDTEYHRSGQYVAGLQNQQYAQQQHQQPAAPPIFPAPGTYPVQNTSNYAVQNTSTYPVQNSSMLMPNNVQTSKPEETVSENQIDFSSVKGIFGWTSIDGVDVPYIFRKDKMFVSVRIVEQKLLNKYPNSYPDDLGKHQPLTSFFITPHECKLLNEINQVHCGGEFGTKLFSIKDLIVLLSDFVEFYNLVKKTFPENGKTTEEEDNKASTGSECGWLQVNNTVSPYVKRKADKFVPLSVMKYAAALNIPGTGVLPETDECDLLNKACKIAGFNFSFSKTTRIISLCEIMKSCKIKIMELPMENPLQHAQYIELPSNNNNETNQKPIEPTPKPEQQTTSKSPVHDMVPGQYHPNQMHPAFMDPRMMFSYTRHPYNMYAMQYGPPNVTVNPQQQQHHMYPGMGPPPPYVNGQMPNQPVHGSRNPTPERRPSQSPVRTHSNGSGSSTPQPKSPNRLTSPNHYQQMRPQLSPGSYHGPTSQPQGLPMPANKPPNNNMPPGQMPPGQIPPGQMPPGHNMMFPNPMANFMQNRGQFMAQNMRPNVRPAMLNNNHLMPQRHPSSKPQTNPNVRTPNQSNMRAPQSSTGGRHHMPPPPSMSGPHQGPMNALQSMVSHQNGNVRQGVPQNISQTNQRHIPNGFNPNAMNQPPQRQANLNNNQKNVLRQHVHNTERPRNDTNDSVINGDGNFPRHMTSGPNNQENKGPEKSINQLLVESIKGVWLGGKSISCMHLNSPGRGGKFCLVEAVCKLYFSGCSVNEFLYALENVLKVPLMTCTDDEEKAFIHYYSLPVTVLKCNKMIDFEDLEKFFPQLSYVFKEKTGNGGAHKTMSQSDSDSASENPVQHDPAMPVTMSEMQQSNKRPSSTPISGPPAKTSKRLEDTVQRLMHQQEMTTGGTENPSGRGAIIILDD
ncbi:uncharacterized protein LOC143071921 [Mytilus galloprovincialis]|uniref:uncharacterized protein LOC143071921 n=1 Tax=Mytilus galloprovincialis TaxID=29158 RepID=UPI003F7C5A03